MLFASELSVATQSINYVIYPNAYNYASYSLGDLIIPYNGPNPTDNWIGPIPMGIARPQEQSTAIPVTAPWAVQYITASVGNAGMDWVFLIDAAAASATRRITMYEYNREVSQFNWKGFVTLNLPSNPGAVTTYLTKGFRMTRTLYSSGSATANGQYITGSPETQWMTSGMAAGARIGFGSTDPTQVASNKWFDISTIYNNTTMQISQSTTPIISSSYVIDELRAVTLNWGTVFPSGGLFLTKGLSYNTFQPAGLNILSASSADNARATYWMLESPSGSGGTAITLPSGIGIETMSADYTTQNVHALQGAGASSVQIFKFNIRAPLTGSLTVYGKTSGSFILSTSLQVTTNALPAVAGNNNNGRIGTLLHGSAAGTASFYFATIKNVLCCPLGFITTGSTNFVQYTMNEQPPFGVAAFPLSNVLNSVEISEKMDKIFIPTSGATSNRMYVSTFKTDNTAIENIIFSDNKQQDQGSVTPAVVPPYPTVDILPFSVWTEGGMTYICRGTTAPAAAINQVYAIPLPVHYEYTSVSKEVLITPAISTPSATKYYRVYVNMMKQVGSDALGFSPEAYKVYARTGGITDDSGAWTLVNDAGTLTGMTPASLIQFKIEFKSLGMIGITNRFYGLTVTYEAGGYLPSQLQWTLSDSDTTTGTIGFSQTSLFGLVPNLQIDYYRSDTQANVLTQQSTSTTNGTFQYWTGAIWTAGVGTDTIGLRRRFVPSAGLPTGVNVYAKVSTF